MEAVHALERWAGLRSRQDRRCQRTQSLFGRPRSMSTIALFDKVTLTPFCLLNGTEMSAARTATYATTMVDRFLFGRHDLSVFIFGAGPIAERVILGLGILAHEAFSKVFIRSRSVDSAVHLAAKLTARVAFPLVVVDDNSELGGWISTSPNMSTRPF